MEGKELINRMGVEVTPKEDNEAFSIEQLREGQFAEADNGTIVVKLSPRTSEHEAINIANGIGGYSKTGTKFTVLRNKTLTIRTNDNGYIIY